MVPYIFTYIFRCALYIHMYLECHIYSRTFSKNFQQENLLKSFCSWQIFLRPLLWQQPQFSGGELANLGSLEIGVGAKGVHPFLMTEKSVKDMKLLLCIKAISCVLTNVVAWRYISRGAGERYNKRKMKQQNNNKTTEQG